MARLFRGIKEKFGQPPGTLIYVGEAQAVSTTFAVIHYTGDSVDEFTAAEPDELFRRLATLSDEGPTWILVRGLSDTEAIGAVGEHFEIHPLLVEDILNTRQRPKVDQYEQVLYASARLLSLNEDAEIRTEQLSLVLMPGLLVSFQESNVELLEAAAERIRKDRGRIRDAGSDYLLSCLLDLVVDHYFLILERLADKAEALEEDVLERMPQDAPVRVNSLKRQMAQVRRAVWPLREVVSSLTRRERGLIVPETVPYLRDVQDHTVQAAEIIELLREMLAGMLDLYMSRISNRMNEVMKVLTIIATLFIPITFIAGVYGMNFTHMPELGHPWGYPAVLGLMAAVTAGLLVFFHRRGWL